MKEIEEYLMSVDPGTVSIGLELMRDITGMERITLLKDNPNLYYRYYWNVDSKGITSIWCYLENKRVETFYETN